MVSRRFRFLIVPLLLAAACNKSGGDTKSKPAPDEEDAEAIRKQRIASLLVSDMTEANEGRYHGVPDEWNWALRPRVGMGNDPGTFRAMIAWGQIYLEAAGSGATNTRVQVRNIEAWLLSKTDGKWHLLQQAETVQGAAYREDFAGDVNVPANLRDEPDGGVSVKLEAGHNFHFWNPTGRVNISPDDIAGLVTAFQARLVVDDPAAGDDRANARFVASAGGDYWLSLTAEWDNFKTNNDFAIGRGKMVGTEWRTFTSCTICAGENETIAGNPPPLTHD